MLSPLQFELDFSHPSGARGVALTFEPESVLRNTKLEQLSTAFVASKLTIVCSNAFVQEGIRFTTAIVHGENLDLFAFAALMRGEYVLTFEAESKLDPGFNFLEVGFGISSWAQLRNITLATKLYRAKGKVEGKIFSRTEEEAIKSLAAMTEAFPNYIIKRV